MRNNLTSLPYNRYRWTRKPTKDWNNYDEIHCRKRTGEPFSRTTGKGSRAWVLQLLVPALVVMFFSTWVLLFIYFWSL